MATWSNILFYLLFLSQIFLISYYLSNKILGRLKSTLTSYPPSDYPKLYPKPLEYYIIWQWSFKMANRVILLLGFVILFLILFVVDHANFADDGYISEAWPLVYGLIQFMPLMIMEFSGYSQLKLMRETNSGKTRKAELHRRSLFNYVSPAIFGLAVFLYFTAIILDLYVHDFVIQWGHDTVQRAMVLTGTNIFMATIVGWFIYGPKLNPHQALGDRAKQATANLKAMLYVSMAMSLYFMTAAIDDVYKLDFLDASLLSLYFQIIAFVSVGHVLQNLKLEDIDFNVYKNDTPVETDTPPGFPPTH